MFEAIINVTPGITSSNNLLAQIGHHSVIPLYISMKQFIVASSLIRHSQSMPTTAHFYWTHLLKFRDFVMQAACHYKMLFYSRLPAHWHTEYLLILLVHSI